MRRWDKKVGKVIGHHATQGCHEKTHTQTHEAVWVDTLLFGVPIQQLVLLLQVGREKGLDPLQQGLVSLLPVLTQTSNLLPLFHDLLLQMIQLGGGGLEAIPLHLMEKRWRVYMHSTAVDV